jgi:hypothetical protein
MMTGIPPPRFYDYAWKISRLNDKGFSPYLREIVAAMQDPRMWGRPNALELVGRAEEGWRAWRANMTEGSEYVDVRDKELENVIERGSHGLGRVVLLLRYRALIGFLFEGSSRSDEFCFALGSFQSVDC